MNPPTREMEKEAATAGFYASPWGQHPRIQILTVEEILSGKGIDYPAPRSSNVTIKRPPVVIRRGETLPLPGIGAPLPAQAKDATLPLAGLAAARPRQRRRLAKTSPGTSIETTVVKRGR
jgi:hypothetical protein